MRRVLVTGAAGFIGSWLTERLLARGDRVVGFDNFDPFYDRSIKERNLTAARGSDGFRLVEGDLRDAREVRALMEALTPLVQRDLTAGPHTFEATFPNGRQQQRTVEIGPDSRFVSFAD